LAATNLKGDRAELIREAKALLREAAVKGATDFATYFYFGVLHNLENNLPAALQAYARSIELNPSFAPAYAYRSRVLIRMGRYDEALQGIEYAYHLAGNVVSGWQVWQGLIQLELGQNKAAGESFRRALSAIPGNAYAHAAAASFHALAGEWENARLHVDELRKLTPDKSDEWRLREFNTGAGREPLISRLGRGLRVALEAQPSPPSAAEKNDVP
jgi:tetratricopeptide (TPR) repeat protein